MTKKDNHYYAKDWGEPPRLNFDPSWDVMMYPQIGRYRPKVAFQVSKGDKKCSANLWPGRSSDDSEWFVYDTAADGISSCHIPYQDGEKLIDFIKSIVDGDDEY